LRGNTLYFGHPVFIENTINQIIEYPWEPDEFFNCFKTISNKPIFWPRILK